MELRCTMKLPNWYSRPITIDDQAVTVEVKRLTQDEFDAFTALMRHARLRFLRRVKQRPLAEQAIEQNADVGAFEEAMRADDEAERKEREEISEILTRYVRFPAGQLEDDHGPIESGDQIVRAFGGSRDVLATLVAAIRSQGQLTPEEKKRLISPSASGSGSAASPPPNDASVPGAGPAATAGPV
jgi:hypothetical protein